MTPEEIEKNKQENDKILKATKRFIDDTRTLIAEGSIVFGFYFGEMPESFVMTPQHAKRLSMILAHQIANYESVFGPIAASWTPPNVQSPIQPSDLQDPPQDSSAGGGANKGPKPPEKPQK